ncbi:MAG: sodium:solute symporter, partial [Cyclobacteriaceae bacterium]|nr:sodium:solute symporter [Cyclobacteriaceae bacterium]
NIYELVGISSILSLVSLFAPLVFGLYWKRASSRGALLSMVSGILVWLLAKQMDLSWPSLVPALVVSIVMMIAGSLIWKDKVAYDNR